MATTSHSDFHPLESAQEIEQELTSLWREMSSSDQPIGRARVLTLITVTDDARESELAELLNHLSHRHPARNLLLLLGDGGAPEQFDATVSLQCDIRGGALCAEQIRLHASGAARERLPGAVRALSSADLPIVLWWTLAPGADLDLFERLAAQVDRVIIDSSCLDNARDLVEFLIGENQRGVTDLNWSRLTPWRETIAQFFDPLGHQLYLEKLDQIHIRTGRRPIGGWLLAGWLASRLGWTLEPLGGDVARWRGEDNGGGILRVSPTDGDGAIEGVSLHAGEVTFEVARGHDGCIESRMALPGESPFRQIVHLDDERDAALLSRELDLLMRDNTYEEAVAALRPVWENEV